MGQAGHRINFCNACLDREGTQLCVQRVAPQNERAAMTSLPRRPVAALRSALHPTALRRESTRDLARLLSPLQAVTNCTTLFATEERQSRIPIPNDFFHLSGLHLQPPIPATNASRE